MKEQPANEAGLSNTEFFLAVVFMVAMIAIVGYGTKQALSGLKQQNQVGIVVASNEDDSSARPKGRARIETSPTPSTSSPGTTPAPSPPD